MSRTRPFSPNWRVACLIALLASHGQATSAAPPAPLRDPTMDALMLNAGFLSAHPDLRFRLLGLEQLKKGQPAQALTLFQRAALYADKPSQAMVAELYWNGSGTAVDRALAYVWMDLAAERGYLPFVTDRERYWSRLDAEERERALVEGPTIYAKYGDDVAETRLARVLRTARAATTGSRTGFVGNLKIILPTPTGEMELDGSQFHDPQYWDPVKYRQWHDTVWQAPKLSTVTIGGLENAPAKAPSGPPPQAAEDPGQDD